MGKSLKECQRDVDSREFAYWKAWYRIEPFGEERADYRSAIIACTIANAHRQKGRSAFKIDDFMPKFGDAATRQEDPKVLQAKMFQYAKQWNAYYESKGGKVDDASNQHSDSSVDDPDGALPAGDRPVKQSRLEFL